MHPGRPPRPTLPGRPVNEQPPCAYARFERMGGCLLRTVGAAGLPPQASVWGVEFCRG